MAEQEKGNERWTISRWPDQLDGHYTVEPPLGYESVEVVPAHALDQANSRAEEAERELGEVKSERFEVVHNNLVPRARAAEARLTKTREALEETRKRLLAEPYEARGDVIYEVIDPALSTLPKPPEFEQAATQHRIDELWQRAKEAEHRASEFEHERDRLKLELDRKEST